MQKPVESVSRRWGRGHCFCRWCPLRSSDLPYRRGGWARGRGASAALGRTRDRGALLRSLERAENSQQSGSCAPIKAPAKSQRPFGVSRSRSGPAQLHHALHALRAGGEETRQGHDSQRNDESTPLAVLAVHPFPARLVVLSPALGIHARRLGVGGRVGVGVAQQRLDACQHRRHVVYRAPVVLQDVQADAPVRVDCGGGGKGASEAGGPQRPGCPPLPKRPSSTACRTRCWGGTSWTRTARWAPCWGSPP